MIGAARYSYPDKIIVCRCGHTATVPVPVGTLLKIDTDDVLTIQIGESECTKCGEPNPMVVMCVRAVGVGYVLLDTLEVLD